MDSISTVYAFGSPRPPAQRDTQSSSAKAERLSRVVDLLLSCVYSPSLQQAHTVLLGCENVDIEIWLCYNGEKAAALVELVLKGLEYDQHAIDLITKLSHVKQLRDLMLEHKPQLLDGLSKASLANERSFEKYSPSVAALLGPPLDSEYTLPASLNRYILTLIQALAENKLCYLQHVQLVLRHNALACLRSISSNQQYTLTSTLANLLSSKEPDVVLLVLSCLASLARSDLVPEGKRDTNNTASLFVGDKGQKVLRLVMGTINSQLSCEHPEEGRQTPEEIFLALNVISSISEDTLADWLSRKEGMATMRKLVEKLDLQVDCNVVMNGCILLSSLSKRAGRVIPNFQPVATRIVDRTLSFLANSNPSRELMTAMSNVLQFIDPESPSVAKISSRILSFVNSNRPPTNDWEQRLEVEMYLQLASSLKMTPVLHSSINLQMTSDDGFGLLNSFIRPHTREIVNIADRDRWHELERLICHLVLDIQMDDDLIGAAKLDLRLRKLLVVKMASIPHLNCEQLPRKSVPREAASISIQQTVNTPHSGHDSRAWRERLRDDLQIEASHQHSSLINRVDIICRDLERRAEIHEEPLRDAENALAIAHNTIRRLESQISEATSELQQRDTENQNAFEERQRLEGAISDLIAEVEVGNNRVKVLQDNERILDETISSGRRELLEVETSLRHELTLERDRSTKLQSELDCVRNDLVREETENDSLTTKLQDSDRTMVHYKEEAQRLQSLIEETEAETERKFDAEVQKCEEQLAQCHELERNLIELQGKLHDATNAMQHSDDRLQQLGEQIASLQEERETLRSLVEQTRAAADERLNLEQERYTATLKNAADELQMTKERADEAMKIIESENGSLRSALSRLKGSYAKRCDEFQKAQELSRRLMAVMGGGASQTTPPSNRDNLFESPLATSTAALKRQKEKPASPSKRVGRTLSEADLTTDETFDKENPPLPRTNRRTSRREDSAILTELSGLGI